MSDPILQFFAFQHLPPHLQAVSRPFGELAETIARPCPGTPSGRSPCESCSKPMTRLFSFTHKHICARA